MAASNGTLIAVGKQTRRTYSIDLYIPDAVATDVTFNAAGLAASTSPASYRVPEDVVIVDIIAVAAPTAVGASLGINGAVANGGTVRWNNQLASLPNRAKLSIGIRGGDFISMRQF
jgi:hypothetical protein